ncbi:MAG: MFS transporter [Chloroflexota bacterium]
MNILRNNFGLLTAISALAFVSIGITAPLTTIYFQSLGASYIQISWILTSFGIAVLVCNYGWGQLSDRLGKRKLFFIIGLCGIGVSALFMSQVPDANWAWGVRLQSGIFHAAYTTVGLALIGDILDHQEAQNPGRKGRSMGIYRGVGSLAFAIGATAGGRIADLYSLPVIYIVSGVIYLVAALCALLLREATRHHDERDTVAVDRHSPVTPAIEKEKTSAYQGLPYLFLIGVILWMMAHSASASMWPNYMESLNYSKTAIGSLWGLTALIEWPAMMLAGMLSDTLGRATILAFGGFGIALVNFGYLAIAHLFPALVGIQIIRGLGFANYTIGAMTFTADVGSDKNRGRNSGLFYTASSGGQLLGSFIGGSLVEFRGFTFMFGFCSLSAFFAGVCFLLLRRVEKLKSL